MTLWLAIAQENPGLANHSRGYRATVDWPAVSLWRELIAANPKAKVILTVRDPEHWYESASATIFARMRTFADALARNDARSLDLRGAGTCRWSMQWWRTKPSAAI
ncbi:MAG: sulfotransferase [Hyphomicrobiales bacterium]